MNFKLTRPRLWYFYSIMGYTIHEIDDITHWGAETIQSQAAEWRLPWSHRLGASHELRRNFETLREERGLDAALEAVDEILAPVANE